jgi:hypothetical protein
MPSSVSVLRSSPENAGGKGSRAETRCHASAVVQRRLLSFTPTRPTTRSGIYALPSLPPTTKTGRKRTGASVVEKIVIKPTGPYKPIDFEIHGKLSTLLRASTEGTIEEPKSMGALVAGDRL